LLLLRRVASHARSSVVYVSVCVCWSRVCCVKTAEPIDMPFEGWGNSLGPKGSSLAYRKALGVSTAVYAAKKLSYRRGTARRAMLVNSWWEL